MRPPSEAVLNSRLTDELGKPVLMIDVIQVRPEDRFSIAFKSQSGDWRQGIWLAVVGEIEIGGERAAQWTVWTDTAPSEFDVSVLRTEDGLLRLYNIWDSRRGYGQESQRATSGMLKETSEGVSTYRCSDIGLHPTFEKLVFEVRRIAN